MAPYSDHVHNLPMAIIQYSRVARRVASGRVLTVSSAGANGVIFGKNLWRLYRRKEIIGASHFSGGKELKMSKTEN